MSWILPDGILDDTHKWQNANDRVAYERAFRQGSYAEHLMAEAQASASPFTTEEDIREGFTAPMFTPQPPPSPPVTVVDCFGGLPDPHLYDQAPTNWSGSNAEFEGTSIPQLPFM